MNNADPVNLRLFVIRKEVEIGTDVPITTNPESEIETLEPVAGTVTSASTVVE
jgi:hypothetical protein